MTDDKKTNPWGLTPREVEALTALIDLGNNKLAGRQLGVQAKTIESLTKTARGRMERVTKKPISRLQAAVVWDRFARSQT